MYVMCMLSKVNLKKENISADLVIWIINKQCLEIPLTGYVLLFFFNHDLSYRLLNAPNLSGAPNGNFRENICSEDDLRTRIFGTFFVKFLACLPLLGFSSIYKMV